MADGINFNLLGVGEASPFQQAQQRDIQNQLVQQQLASGRMQQELSGINLANAKRERDALAALQQKFVENGHSPDLSKNFRAMVESGIPHYVDIGMKGMQALQNQARFRELMGGSAAPAAAAPAEPQPMQSEGLQVYPVPTPSSANALAPAAAPVATPSPTAVNALTMPDEEAQLERKIAAAYEIGDARSLAWAKTQAKKLEDLRKAHVISPGGVLVQGNKAIYTAPAKTPELPTSVQELNAYLRMTPEEKIAYEKLQKIKATNVTATANVSPAGKSLAAPIGERADISRTKAEGAAGIMENANMVREALNTGNIIAGPLAGPRMKFAQVLDLAGAGDKQKLVNTRNAIQGLATLTLESRAELKGQGQVTENEQKLLERARSGSIEDMTITELQQIVNVSQRLANRLWSSHETLLKTMEKDPAAKDVIQYYRPTVVLPSAVNEGKPKAETDKRKAGLDAIFGSKR